MAASTIGLSSTMIRAARFLGVQRASTSIVSANHVTSSSTMLPAIITGVTRGMSTVLEGLKYAKSHEWVKVEGDEATIGVSDFAQSELGDVVYVEVPEVGTEFDSVGKSFGVLESTKAASDVYTPVTGTVTAVNEELADNPGLVNESPFEGGWLMKVKMSDASQLDALMDAAAYEKHCG